jgi:glutamate-1-semialdehyde 2,1-aminomutase
MSTMTDDLTAAVADAQARYVAANPASHGLHVERQRSMPGGNTRTVIHLAPFPLTIAKASGATLTDVDDHEYTDFLGEYTAGLYGHSHPIILGAVREALADGICFGAPNEYEAGLAAAVCERFPSIELVRFTNSGTEANLLAIALARVHTGREAIMVFEGGYHGGVFFYATTAGSPINAPFPTLMGQYNDADGAARMIAEHAHELAAVIVEPLQGSGGCIPAEQGFLEALRTATAEHGVMLIFDEVMTSRLSAGGLQLVTGVTPDLTSLGKYIGGGLTFGAFGGRTELMERFDPTRADALPHAGTFNNNVLTMAAGLAGLTQVYTAAAAEELNASGDRLRERLTAAGEARDLPFFASGRGSMVGLHFGRPPLRSVADIKGDPGVLGALRELLHLHCLEHGCSYGRRGFMALSLPLTGDDHDRLVQAVEAFLDERGDLVRLAA